MPKCSHCKDTQQQMYVHNTWEVWQDYELYLDSTRQKEAIVTVGPCHYCTPFKWAVLHADNSVCFYDNEEEARDDEKKGNIVIHMPRSFEEKGEVANG